MSNLVLDISMSLDGYVAGPEPSDAEPLGRGGELLHEWVLGLAAWREPHGRSGGERTEESAMIEELRGRTGATIMGRRMFSGGEGAWDDDGHARGWWGDDPPFHHPVYVLTHHGREPLEMEGGTTFTFVTGGVGAALEQARDAAGDRDVLIGGGAEAAQQFLIAGEVDELRLHVAPVFLGAGRRLFEHHLDRPPASLERTDVIVGPSGVTHLMYRPAG